MAATVGIFKTRFPEYSDDTDYPDVRVQLFLDDAVLLHIGDDEVRWGGKYDVAHAYLAAHLLAVGDDTELGDTNTKVGPVASKSAGGVSVSRAVVAKDRSDLDDFYAGSSYGQQFLNIRNRCFAGALVASLT